MVGNSQSEFTVKIHTFIPRNSKSHFAKVALVILEMLDDRSRIASYLAIITLYKVIIVGAINFKMAASSLVCVTEEVMNM